MYIWLSSLRTSVDGFDRVIYIVAQREHKAIVDNRKDKEAGVSWEEYRHNMTFTNMVD